MGYLELEYQSTPIFKLKRMFRLPRHRRMTRAKIMEIIKKRNANVHKLARDLKARPYNELLKIAGIAGGKGVTKHRVIKYIIKEKNYDYIHHNFFSNGSNVHRSYVLCWLQKVLERKARWLARV